MSADALPDHSTAAVEPTELWTVRSEIRRRAVAEPVEVAHHVMALEAEVLALRADADRLASGLHARGIIPGRNPDGINDDAEKALTLYDDAMAEVKRLRVLEAMAGVRERHVKHAETERDRLQEDLAVALANPCATCQAEADRLRAENERLWARIRHMNAAGGPYLYNRPADEAQAEVARLKRLIGEAYMARSPQPAVALRKLFREANSKPAPESDETQRIGLEDVDYRGGGLMGMRSPASRDSHLPEEGDHA